MRDGGCRQSSTGTEPVRNVGRTAPSPHLQTPLERLFNFTDPPTHYLSSVPRAQPCILELPQYFKGAIHCDLTGAITLLARLIIGLMTMSAKLPCKETQKKQGTLVLPHGLPDYLWCVYSRQNFSPFAVVDQIIFLNSNIATW